jgi:hypothetical protein
MASSRHKQWVTTCLASLPEVFVSSKQMASGASKAVDLNTNCFLWPFDQRPGMETILQAVSREIAGTTRTSVSSVAVTSSSRTTVPWRVSHHCTR